MKIEELYCISDQINVEQYLKFYRAIKSCMKDPDWLGDYSKEELEDTLRNGGKIWIFFNDQDVVCSMMGLPSIDKTSGKRMVSYGPMLVNPKYIGNHLQYQMLKVLDQYYSSICSYAMTTAHPNNIYSTRNLEEGGFKLVGTQTLKRGLRNIYVKDLVKNKIVPLDGNSEAREWHPKVS